MTQDIVEKEKRDMKKEAKEGKLTKTTSQPAAKKPRTGQACIVSAHTNVDVEESKYRPIIVAPSLVTSLVNITNIKPFLENAEFKRPPTGEEVLRITPGTRERIVRVDPLTGARQEYDVYSSIDGFRKEQWEHVVAVFVIGAAWQLKGFMWDNPVDIFNNGQRFSDRISVDMVSARILCKIRG